MRRHVSCIVRGCIAAMWVRVLGMRVYCGRLRLRRDGGSVGRAGGRGARGGERASENLLDEDIRRARIQNVIVVSCDVMNPHKITKESCIPPNAVSPFLQMSHTLHTTSLPFHHSDPSIPPHLHTSLLSSRTPSATAAPLVLCLPTRGEHEHP